MHHHQWSNPIQLLSSLWLLTLDQQWLKKNQFNFNTDRISALRRIFAQIRVTRPTSSSKVYCQNWTLNQRDKILKITDRHGLVTVHGYLDDPLADSALKLRTAVYWATRKRIANKPYSRGGGRGGFNTIQKTFSWRQQRILTHKYQQNYHQQFSDGLYFYRKKARTHYPSCPYKGRTFSSTSHYYMCLPLS